MMTGVPLLVLCFLTMNRFLDGDIKLGLIFAASTAFVGLFFALVLVRTKIWFNRESDHIAIRKRTVRGTTTAFYKVSDLRSAVVQTTNSGDTSTHRCALMFSDETVPLTRAYTSGKAADHAADAINGWLSAHHS